MNNQSNFSPSHSPSINFQGRIKPVSTKNSTATSPTRTAFSGARFSTQVSGSTSGSSNLNPVGSTGGFGGGAIREITITVPVGAKVPAVFFDVEDKPMAQQKALDRIAKEFEKNVSEIPPGLQKEEVWEAAREIADERYLTLFGYQAFNQYHIQSAKEALKEKRAIPKAP